MGAWRLELSKEYKSLNLLFTFTAETDDQQDLQDKYELHGNQAVYKVIMTFPLGLPFSANSIAS